MAFRLIFRNVILDFYGNPKDMEEALALRKTWVDQISRVYGSIEEHEVLIEEIQESEGKDE